jgi:glycine hydroxymethyltransferase
LIIAGSSSYPRQIDFAKFSQIAKQVGAYLMADIAHIVGLIVAGLHPHPFPDCDIVTTSSHKTLRGSRGGLILCQDKELAQKIDKAVFPGLQGGPLENEIAGKAIALKEAQEPSFIQYQKQIVKNAQVLAETLLGQGLDLITGGTDIHFVLVDLTKTGLSGKQAEEALEQANLYVNRNVIPNEQRSKWETSGIRIGTPAVTSKGLKEEEMAQVGLFIAKIIKQMDNKRVRQEVKKQVIEIAKRFPVL